MKKNKNSLKNGLQEKRGNKIILLIVSFAVIMLILFFLMFSEAVASGKVTIINNTSMDISKVDIYFDNINSDIYLYTDEEPYRSENIITASVNANETVTGDFDNVNLYLKDAELFVGLTVDGEDMVFCAGEFNTDFKGKVQIKIFEENDEVLINIKATSGVFGLFSETKCNVTYLFKN